MAVNGGRAATGSPSAAAIATVALAVAAFTAAIGLGSSLTALTGTPERFGAPWDFSFAQPYDSPIDGGRAQTFLPGSTRSPPPPGSSARTSRSTVGSSGPSPSSPCRASRTWSTRPSPPGAAPVRADEIALGRDHDAAARGRDRRHRPRRQHGDELGTVADDGRRHDAHQRHLRGQSGARRGGDSGVARPGRARGIDRRIPTSRRARAGGRPGRLPGRHRERVRADGQRPGGTERRSATSSGSAHSPWCVAAMVGVLANSCSPTPSCCRPAATGAAGGAQDVGLHPRPGSWPPVRWQATVLGAAARPSALPSASSSAVAGWRWPRQLGRGEWTGRAAAASSPPWSLPSSSLTSWR